MALLPEDQTQRPGPVETMDPAPDIQRVEPQSGHAQVVGQIQDGVASGGTVTGQRAADIAKQIARNSKVGLGTAPEIGLITPGQAEMPEEIDPSELYLDDLTFDDANLSGVGIGNTEATTREVTDDELVSNQLEGLVSGDSRYIRNARMRAMEQANQRGAFGSSFAAGAAERAAIESALPIAQNDAQAHRDVATQNMAALNQFAMANLQRATTLDQALLSANTSRHMANLDAGVRSMMANLDAATKINISNLDAETQTNIANLNNQTNVAIQKMVNDNQRVLQGQQFRHDALMEDLKQTGRIDLANIDAELRKDLEQFAQEGRIDLANLDHENRLALEDVMNDYKIQADEDSRAFERGTQHANLAMQAQLNYTNYVTAYADVSMDSAAAARLSADAWNKLSAEMQLINGLYPEFDAIVPERSQQVTAHYNTGKKKKGKKG